MTESPWARLNALSDNDPLNLRALPTVRLPELVTRIRRSTARGRRKAAQDPQTVEFLAAGLRVIEREFASGAHLSSDGDATTAPFFSWLSRARVADEVDLRRLPRAGSRSAEGEEVVSAEQLRARLRGLWEPHSNYLADLLTVALALEHWSAPAYMDQERVAAVATGDLVDAAHELAFYDLEMILHRHVATYRLQLIAAALADREPALRQSLMATYEMVDKSWGSVYAGAFAGQGLVLREGFTLDMFSQAMTALAEGLAMRLLVEPGNRTLMDPGTRRSLLGTMALAIAASCTTRKGDTRTVEEYVRDVLTS